MSFLLIVWYNSMRVFKNWYISIILLILMILRFIASGKWFGSVVVAGVLVTWIDTTNKIWKENLNVIGTRKKARYAIVLLAMFFIGLIQVVLIVVNSVMGIEWLNLPIVLDEITLFALLICLSQNEIIGLLNKIIRK